MATGVRIGTAGWAIPAQVRDAFATGDSALARYATRMDAVEINSSFYRPHQPATYAKWAAAVPVRFRFSVKLPRDITHEARLWRCGDALSAFADQIAGLGDRMGPVLVQLPPSLAWERRLVGTFWRLLRRRFDGPVACEARHASWFDADSDAMLAAHGIARVVADPLVDPRGAAPGGDTSWSYWRLHGAPVIYRSGYDSATLVGWQARMQAAPGRGERWCIFDNTAQGRALPDALALQQATRVA